MLKLDIMKNEKLPGEIKIDEYVDRINAGEPADTILNGLPDSMRKAVEDKLAQSKVESEGNEYRQDFEVIIPSHLRDQPADVLEEVWQLTLHSDPEIAAKQIAERQRIIDKRRYEEEQERILFEEIKIADGLEIEKIREKLNESSEPQIEQKPLSIEEIQTLIKSLPHVPVAEGNPMMMPDPRILQSKGKQDLHPGDKIYTIGPNGPVIAEVISKGDKGQIVLRLEDGTDFPTMFLGDTYLIEDLQRIKFNSNPNIFI